MGQLVVDGISSSAFQQETDPDMKLTILTHCLTDALQSLAPLKARKNAGPLGKSPLWYNEDLRTLKKQLRAAERHWRKNHADKKMIYLESLNTYKKAIRTAKKQYFSTRIQQAANSTSELFRITT